MGVMTPPADKQKSHGDTGSVDLQKIYAKAFEVEGEQGEAPKIGEIPASMTQDFKDSVQRVKDDALAELSKLSMQKRQTNNNSSQSQSQNPQKRPTDSRRKVIRLVQ